MIWCRRFEPGLLQGFSRHGASRPLSWTFFQYTILSYPGQPSYSLSKGLSRTTTFAPAWSDNLWQGAVMRTRRHLSGLQLISQLCPCSRSGQLAVDKNRCTVRWSCNVGHVDPQDWQPDCRSAALCGAWAHLKPDEQFFCSIPPSNELCSARLLGTLTTAPKMRKGKQFEDGRPFARLIKEMYDAISEIY